MYEDENGQQKIVQAHAHGEIVRQIADTDDVSAENILKEGMKKGKFESMTLNKDKNIIKEVNQSAN